MAELAQVSGVVPVALKRRAFAALALNGDKFRAWLLRKMEEDFAEGGNPVAIEEADAKERVACGKE